MSHYCYPCPCCGYQTYLRPAGGTMQICPVCFWEDAAGEEPWNGSNSVRLGEAQRNFAELGVCNRDFADVVRPPLPEEARPPDWLSFQDLATAIVSMIENSFAKVALGNGMTIHQREAINKFKSAEEFEKARLLDREMHWLQIPAEKIQRLGTSLTFLDPASITYHLPAFMCHGLRVWMMNDSFGDVDAIFYSLDSGPRSNGYHADSFLLLDHRQLEAVAAFLKFVALVDPMCWHDATKCLEKGWGKWLPDSLPFSKYPPIYP